MHLLLIVIASFIASWGFEWIKPSPAPDGVSDLEAYSHLQILTGFVLIAIALLLGYVFFIVSNIVKFKKEGMRALSLMTKEMENSQHEDDKNPS